MDFKSFLSTYSGIRQENWYYRVICAVLVISNLFLGVAVLARKEVVVLVPPILKEQVKVGINKADQKYQESWALFFALLLGNITPKNLEFVVNEVQKYMAPAIYDDLMKDIAEQSKSIEGANISTSFEPRELGYDEKTGHVLIKGQMVLRGAFGKPQSINKTYEFGIAIKNYYPQITYLDAYEKKPRPVEEKPHVQPQPQSSELEDKKPGN